MKPKEKWQIQWRTTKDESIIHSYCLSLSSLHSSGSLSSLVSSPSTPPPHQIDDSNAHSQDENSYIHEKNNILLHSSKTCSSDPSPYVGDLKSQWKINDNKHDFPPSAVPVGSERINLYSNHVPSKHNNCGANKALETLNIRKSDGNTCDLFGSSNQCDRNNAEKRKEPGGYPMNSCGVQMALGICCPNEVNKLPPISCYPSAPNVNQHLRPADYYRNLPRISNHGVLPFVFGQEESHHKWQNGFHHQPIPEGLEMSCLSKHWPVHTSAFPLPHHHSSINGGVSNAGYDRLHFPTFTGVFPNRYSQQNIGCWAPLPSEHLQEKKINSNNNAQHQMEALKNQRSQLEKETSSSLKRLPIRERVPRQCQDRSFSEVDLNRGSSVKRSKSDNGIIDVVNVGDERLSESLSQDNTIIDLEFEGTQCSMTHFQLVDSSSDNFKNLIAPYSERMQEFLKEQRRKLKNRDAAKRSRRSKDETRNTRIHERDRLKSLLKHLSKCSQKVERLKYKRDLLLRENLTKQKQRSLHLETMENMLRLFPKKLATMGAATSSTSVP